MFVKLQGTATNHLVPLFSDTVFIFPPFSCLTFFLRRIHVFRWTCYYGVIAMETWAHIEMWLCLYVFMSLDVVGDSMAQKMRWRSRQLALKKVAQSSGDANVGGRVSRWRARHRRANRLRKCRWRLRRTTQHCDVVLSNSRSKIRDRTSFIVQNLILWDVAFT
jgi:hypothetical protein